MGREGRFDEVGGRCVLQGGDCIDVQERDDGGRKSEGVDGICTSGRMAFARGEGVSWE